MKLGIIKTTPDREAFFGFIRKLVIFPDNLEAMTCMKRSLLLWLLASVNLLAAFGQSRREDIYSDFVLYPKRAGMEKDLRQRIIEGTFAMPLDSNTSYRFELACSAVTQFQFSGQTVWQGFEKMFAGYQQLPYETKAAFLEALYAVTETKYAPRVRALLDSEDNPVLFALAALYLYRADTSVSYSNELKIRMVERFPGYDTLEVLRAFEQYVSYQQQDSRGRTPDITELFGYGRPSGHKTIYSFQRWNRDYPGLALVQLSDGHFARDPAGRLLVFQQLARSGSSLPYFMADGNTPQGIYSIQGTSVSHNNFIGPTPNIQLILPFEKRWEKYFFRPPGTRVDSLSDYLQLLPPSWRNWRPMLEAWYAGKAGRTQIIAHGTTLDPGYFREKPFYPLTPTMGCLCAKELWNPTSGKLLESEQLDLVNTYLSTPGTNGYCIVINVDDRQKPLSRQELETWVKKYESGIPLGQGNNAKMQPGGLH